MAVVTLAAVLDAWRRQQRWRCWVPSAGWCRLPEKVLWKPVGSLTTNLAHFLHCFGENKYGHQSLSKFDFIDSIFLTCFLRYFVSNVQYIFIGLNYFAVLVPVRTCSDALGRFGMRFKKLGGFPKYFLVCFLLGCTVLLDLSRCSLSTYSFCSSVNANDHHGSFSDVSNVLE